MGIRNHSILQTYEAASLVATTLEYATCDRTLVWAAVAVYRGLLLPVSLPALRFAAKGGLRFKGGTGGQMVRVNETLPF
ncbi:MAG: hypothetical protein H0X25_18250 [Acidobacteriales bacterium]|nr:hypothetical protein [Terriglobales bacterium]